MPQRGSEGVIKSRPSAVDARGYPRLQSRHAGGKGSAGRKIEGDGITEVHDEFEVLRIARAHKGQRAG